MPFTTSTSQNPQADPEFQPFLAHWNSVLNGDAVGNKIRPASLFIKEKKWITAKGKVRTGFRLRMSEDPKAGRGRVRLTFPNFNEAADYYDFEMSKRNSQTRDLSISTTEIHIIHNEMKKLKEQSQSIRDSFPLGRLLSEAVENYIWESQVVTLRQVVEAVIEEQVQLGKVPGAADKKGYIGTIKWAARALYKDPKGRFPEDCNIRTIRPKDLNDFFLGILTEMKRSTARTLHRNLTTICNRAVDWEMLRKNPMHAVKAPANEKQEIVIHGVTQAEALLLTAWDYCPELVPHLAFGYLSGLSPCEIGELTWEKFAFDEGELHVDDEVTKATRSVLKRDVPFVNPEQKAWFKPWEKAAGLVRPIENYEEQLKCIRLLASRIHGVEIPVWFGSIQRRTWMSHLYHSGLVTIDVLKRLSGHHRDSDVGFEHYIAYVKQAAAQAYFKIMPPSRPPGTKSFPPELLKEVRGLNKPGASKSSVKKPANKKKEGNNANNIN